MDNRIPTEGEVQIASKAKGKDWEKTLQAKTNKVDNQQHQNHQDFDIHYSGPVEEGYISEVIDAKLQNGGNHAMDKKQGGF